MNRPSAAGRALARRRFARSLPRWRRRVATLTERDERGVILVFWVLSLTALLGFLALAINLGNLVQSNDNVQNAADSAASPAPPPWQAQTFDEIDMDSTNWPTEYAPAYSVEVSDNGTTWTAIASCTGIGSPEVVSFPLQTAAYIKVILLTGNASTSPAWSIGDFKIYNSSTADAGGGSCAASVSSGTQLNESSFVASTNAPSNSPGSVDAPQNAITNAMDAALTSTASTTRFSTDEPQAPGLYFEVTMSPFDTEVNIPPPYRCNFGLTRCNGPNRYAWLDGYYIYEPLRVGQGLGGGWLRIVDSRGYLPPGEISDREAFRDGTRNGLFPRWSCSFVRSSGNCLQLTTGDPGTAINALSDGAPVVATDAAEAVVQGYGVTADWSGCSTLPAGFYLAKGWAGDNCIAYCDPSQATSSCGTDEAIFWVATLVAAPPSIISNDGVTCTERVAWANTAGGAPGAAVPSGNCS